MIALLVCLALADAIYLLTFINRETLFRGGIIAALIVVYLALNQFASFVWRQIPAKEIAVGFLFALGVAISVSATPTKLLLPFLLFGLLGWLNCLSISFWEDKLDFAQNKISFATEHPRFSFFPLFACVLLALVALAIRMPLPLGFCVASSATLLALLHCFRAIPRDARVALADLVLLTPLLALL